ncbi:hypothetical protein BU15DRAFT_57822 [Melanogaster broomeanus]|nr:hypothetical protein BU15DRAFT_57822 [Melanogaster broomeanus]
MSRFWTSELAQAIKDMEALLGQPDVDALPVIGAIDPALQNGLQVELTTEPPGTLLTPKYLLHPHSAAALPQAASATIQGAEAAAGNGAATDTNTQPQPASEPTPTESSEPPVHPTTTIADSELTEEVFRPLWSNGDPIVVTGILPKFKLQWTPEYFIQKYNPQSCLILECQTDLNKRVTVGEFFSWFGKYEGRVECWKLKDWPPSTDFKTAFPELFEDFSRAVPVPSYARHDATLLRLTLGSKGSTRLHMDMADVLNIMTYAASTPDGKPGSAVWDLFRACDADKLRTFLRRKFKGSYQHDPIHSQQFYLDSTLRKELFDMYGIKSHRVYQRPGEAVLIPAGCAHQVCNLADCVKVAVDFVSPENIAALRTAHEGIQGAEPVDGVEGGRPAAPYNDVLHVDPNLDTLGAPITFMQLRTVIFRAAQLRSTSRDATMSPPPNTTSFGHQQSRLGAVYEVAEEGAFQSSFDQLFSPNCEVRVDHEVHPLQTFRGELMARRAAAQSVAVAWDDAGGGIISTNDDDPNLPSVVAGSLVVTRSLRWLIRAAPAQRMTHIHFSAK